MYETVQQPFCSVIQNIEKYGFIASKLKLGIFDRTVKWKEFNGNKFKSHGNICGNLFISFSEHGEKNIWPYGTIFQKQYKFLTDESKNRMVVKNRRVGGTTLILCDALLNVWNNDETVFICSTNKSSKNNKINKMRELIGKTIPYTIIGGVESYSIQLTSGYIIFGEEDDMIKILDSANEHQISNGIPDTLYIDDAEYLGWALNPSYLRRFKKVVLVFTGNNQKTELLSTIFNWSIHKISHKDIISNETDLNVIEIKKSINKEMMSPASFEYTYGDL